MTDTSSGQEVYLIRYPAPKMPSGWSSYGHWHLFLPRYEDATTGRAIHVLGNFFKGFETRAGEDKDLMKEVTKPCSTDLLCTLNEEKGVENLLDIARETKAPSISEDVKSGLPNCQTWMIEYAEKCVQSGIFDDDVLSKLRQLHQEAVTSTNTDE